MRLNDWSQVTNKLVCPQHMEDLLRVAQIGTGLFHRCTKVAEAGGGGGAHVGHFLGDRNHAAKVAGVCHSLGSAGIFYR